MGKKAAKKIRVKKAAKKRAAVVERSPAPKAPKPTLQELNVRSRKHGRRRGT